MSAPDNFLIVDLIIDASNIKAGGGLTHLQEILAGEAAPNAGFCKVFLWAPNNTLAKIADQPWLQKCAHPLLNGGYLSTWKWKRNVFTPFAKKTKALVYIPGTGSAGVPYVTMCQNLLPLQNKELNRYFFSADWLRLKLLRLLHKQAYKKASGVVFLNRYCLQHAEALIRRQVPKHAIIPHGLAARFLSDNKEIYPGDFTASRPLRLVYVSIIDVYKHQWNVAEAVCRLVKEGYHIHLDLIGPAYPKALAKLQAVLNHYPAEAKSVQYHGAVAYDVIHNTYKQGDAFVFASSCETFGMVLTEAMAAGLPVLCSSMSSMPETAGDAVQYFDPLSVEDLKDAIRKIYIEPLLRQSLSDKSLAKARTMSWEICANHTFQYLFQISQTCVEL